MKKILVVDDDFLVGRNCAKILEAEGFEVSVVRGAEEALKLFREKKFDLLVVDVKMPRRDGLSLLAEIRNLSAETPAIVMSGYPTPETVADIFASEATQFLPKPFKPDDLLAMIRRALAGKEA